jgi:3-methyladenine DNA glycosylase AlkD
MANQLAKSKPCIRLMESWEHSPSALQRRIFWYRQARLRWTGQTPPDNTEALLDALDARMADEAPEVQWAMNFTAAQIGTYQPEHRARCVALGERTGLYRDQKVPRGCTPNYLPTAIPMLAEKAGT